MTQIAREITQLDSGASLTGVIRTSDGSPQDLTEATAVHFTMREVGAASPKVANGIATIVGSPTSGQVRYDFDAADLDTIGDYDYLFAVEYPEGRVTSRGEGVIRVVSNLVDDSTDPVYSSPAFCTVADVRKFSGRDVDEDVIEQAQAMIEIAIGHTAEELLAEDRDPALSTSDRAWLRRACAYQSAWLVFNPDAFEARSASSVSVGGIGGATAQLTEDSVILAPLARKSILRLSWMKSGVKPIGSVGRALDAYNSSRDARIWRPWR